MTLNLQMAHADSLARQAYARIKATDALPSPSGIGLVLLRLPGGEEASRETMAGIVESDPVIAARILRYANSPINNAMQQVDSVSEAVQVLGVSAVRSLALSISLVFGQERVQCPGFAYDPFWSESVGRAVATREVTRLIKGFPPEEGFICGLLSQIGCLAFATVYHVAYSHVLSRARPDDPAGLGSLERAMFEIDHNQLAAEMMTDWGLLIETCEAVRHQDDDAVGEQVPLGNVTAQLAQALHLASSIARVLTRPKNDLATLNALVTEAARFGFGPGPFHDMFDSVALQWRYLASVFGVSARSLPSLADRFVDAVSPPRRVD